MSIEKLAALYSARGVWQDEPLRYRHRKQGHLACVVHTVLPSESAQGAQVILQPCIPLRMLSNDSQQATGNSHNELCVAVMFVNYRVHCIRIGGRASGKPIHGGFF